MKQPRLGTPNVEHQAGFSRPPMIDVKDHNRQDGADAHRIDSAGDALQRELEPGIHLLAA